MGIAILSGTLSSLDSSSSSPIPKWESHTSGTVTPVAFVEEDPALPSRFIACVSREVSAKQLKPAFTEVSRLGASVEICVAKNVHAVKQSDVVLLWSAPSNPSKIIHKLMACPLSCKPQIAHAILSEPGMQEALENKLLVSILAGVTISQLSEMVGPTTKVVRAMPNTPCRVSF
jgi:pyrroline-5-carboxylate reductase